MNYQFIKSEKDNPEITVLTTMEFQTPYLALDFLRQLAYTYRLCGNETVIIGTVSPMLSVYKSKANIPTGKAIFFLTLMPIK